MAPAGSRLALAFYFHLEKRKEKKRKENDDGCDQRSSSANQGLETPRGKRKKNVIETYFYIDAVMETSRDNVSEGEDIIESPVFLL